jgi:hypothetical protein
MSDHVQIKHDGFARTTLYRRIGTPAPCRWCGSPNARFLYAWQNDDNNRPVRGWQGPFCGVSCFRAFCL